MNKKLLLLTMLFVSFTAWAFFADTSFTVTGTVTDQNGVPVGSAIVNVKGMSRQTFTDSAGHFKITVPQQGAVLVITSVGFENAIVKVSSNHLNITLKQNLTALEEVVVTGAYGIKQNNALSGSVPGLYVQKNVFKYQLGYSNTPPSLYNDRVYEAEDKGEEESEPLDREGYDAITENRFKKVTDNPLSTFSIDVDAASYSNLRRYINNGSLPPAGAVRIEEMINYFHYDYPQPTGEHPFSINTEITQCPWNTNHKLALIGLQGKNIPTENLPSSNLVFLVDVSGSMDEPNKLPLVQSSLRLLVEKLRANDKVSIVVYAGNAGLVLAPTPGSNKATINAAIERLKAGGSTAGGEGITLAYKTARENFNKEGNNRVILCTDGDFNVGISSDDGLERMIERERESGIYLSVLGFGMGNYQDAKMQKLADKGNGNHSYIDDISEAKKVLVTEFGGTLFTIAKDVKLQVEFNPAVVQGYRLIGYENRMLNKEDFNNDKKDAGELGSGHTVTALYEIIPAGIKDTMLEKVDNLKYQQRFKTTSNNAEMMTIKFRYKKPNESKSILMVHPVNDGDITFESAGDNLKFAASVAEFGMLLRNSEFKQHSSYQHALTTAMQSLGEDAAGYRVEFVTLVRKASNLKNNHDVGLQR